MVKSTIPAPPQSSRVLNYLSARPIIVGANNAVRGDNRLPVESRRVEPYDKFPLCPAVHYHLGINPTCTRISTVST